MVNANTHHFLHYRAMFSYNASLCLYYACKFAIGVRNKSFLWIIEPLLHAIPFITSLGFSSSCLALGLLNRTLDKDCICVLAPPLLNSTTAGPNKSYYKTLKMILSILSTLNLFIIVLSLSIVIGCTIKANKDLDLQSRILRRVYGQSSKQYRKMNSKKSKAIFIQAAVHLSVYALTILFPLLDNINIVHGKSRWFAKMAIPAQGIFNLFLFIAGQRIHSCFISSTSRQQGQEDLQEQEINLGGYVRSFFRKNFLTPSCCEQDHEFVFISRLSIVECDLVAKQNALVVNSSVLSSRLQVDNSYPRVLDHDHYDSVTDSKKQNQELSGNSQNNLEEGSVEKYNLFNTSRWLAGEMSIHIPTCLSRVASIQVENGTVDFFGDEDSHHSVERNHPGSLFLPCSSSINEESFVHCSCDAEDLSQQKAGGEITETVSRRFYNVVVKP